MANQNNTPVKQSDGSLLTTDRRQQYEGQNGPTTNSDNTGKGTP
jgi:hypothetical protein